MIETCSVSVLRPLEVLEEPVVLVVAVGHRHPCRPEEDRRDRLVRQDHSPVGLVGRPLGAQLPPQWLRVKVRGMPVR